MKRHPDVERIGHRGAPRACFENTMPSFRRAVELGANAVELDVHVSRDGVPVVQHDPDLAGSVTPKRLGGAAIASLSIDELREVRLVSGDALPVLAELLDELAPRVTVYVELKGGSPALVAEVVGRHLGSVAIHSFDHDAIVELRAIAPAIPRGVLVERFTPEDLTALVRRADARDVWPAAKLVDESFMAAATAAGARVIPWTVNRSGDVARLTELGVAGICTDDLSIFVPSD